MTRDFNQIRKEFDDQIDADIRDGGISPVMGSCVKEWFHKAGLELQASAFGEAIEAIRKLQKQVQ